MNMSSLNPSLQSQGNRSSSLCSVSQITQLMWKSQMIRIWVGEEAF